MVKNKRNVNSRRRSRKQNLPRAPPATVLAYKGLIPYNASETGITAVLRDEFSLSTGVGTAISANLDNNPSGTDNWSEYSTSWSEYRVLGVRFQFVPQYAVNTAAIASSPFAHSVLHMKSAPSIASYGQCFSYGDSRFGHINKPFSREWRMNSAEEGTYIDCSSPALTAYIFTYYADSLTAATIYGILFRTWLVQFRNPRK
jgi:hypothetical protein